MLLTLSSNTELLKRFEAIYLSEGVFSLFGSLENESYFVASETLSIDYILIDANPPTKQAKALYDKLSDIFPLAVIVFWSENPSRSDRTPTISSTVELRDFLGKIIESKRSTYDERIFKIVPHDNDARLLGYPIRLTKSEHKILLLLASTPEHTFSYSEIVSLAFPFSQGLSKNQLAVHVCNINKKSVLISGRKLILNPHKSGYTINPAL